LRIGVGFSNGIGNWVIYTSVLQALATLGEVTLVLSDGWKDRGIIQLIAQKCPFISEIVGYPSSFKNGEYDAVYFTVHSIMFDPFLIYVHGVELYNEKRYTAWADSYMHEREFYYQEVREKFDYKGVVFPQYMPVADKLPFEVAAGRKLVIANGYARDPSDGWKRKTWLHFKEFLEDFCAFYPDFTVYIVGGIDDWYWGESLLINERVYNLAGSLNILETARLIQISDFGVYNDSAAMHIADALKRPGIALFGSTLVSKNGPLEGSIDPIRSPITCAPCQGTLMFQECDHREDSMKNIDPDLVMAAVRKKIVI
jgi:ADP-heptose:LPS heptosyltransferase